jgi:GntR family transcriptional regulator
VQLLINPSDELPIYRQIMRQITEAIAGGRLKSGDKLASHRELSEQLVIAPLTVKKAYDELETLGYISPQRGRGTFVSAQLPELDRADQTGQIQQSARRLLTQAYLAGLSLGDVVKLLNEADRELTGIEALTPVELPAKPKETK